MAQILYQTIDGWQRYRCPLSGRDEFDGYEAASKCRDLVRRGAIQATALEGPKVTAHWKRNEYQACPERLIGPEL